MYWLRIACELFARLIEPIRPGFLRQRRSVNDLPRARITDSRRETQRGRMPTMANRFRVRGFEIASFLTTIAIGSISVFHPLSAKLAVPHFVVFQRTCLKRKHQHTSVGQ
jgi:hypothetical protein